MRSHPVTRRAIPLVLAFIGVTLLAGCFYIPLPRTAADKNRVYPDGLLGDSSSKKPIVPHRATKAQVLHILGKPDRESADGRVLGYSFEYRAGVWVYPLCFYAARDRFDTAIRLDFNAESVLVSYRVIKRDKRDGVEIFVNNNNKQVRHDDIRNFLDEIAPVPQRIPDTQPAAPIPGIPDGKPYATP